MKRVVGWGCMADETCEYCHEKPATIYVEDSEIDADGDMVPSCNDCSPPGTIEDAVADILTKLFVQK